MEVKKLSIKILKLTRTRIVIEGEVDTSLILDEVREWAKEEMRIFLHVHYSDEKNQTTIMIRPFDRIHRKETIFWGNNQKTKLDIHKIIMYGDIPTEDGTPMNTIEVGEQVCLPAKKAVDKSVVYIIDKSLSEVTGKTKWTFSFYPISNLIQQDEDSSKMLSEEQMTILENNASEYKNEFGNRLMDIIDSSAADDMDYIEPLKMVRNHILEMLKDAPQTRSDSLEALKAVLD